MSQRRTPGGQRPAGRGAPAARSRKTAPATATRLTVPKPGRPDLRRAESRPSARPAAARTAVARKAAPEQPARTGGRAAIVGLLVLIMLLAYAYPVRVFLSQQAEIAAIEAAQDAQRQYIADLLVERAKWDDKEYVKAQARKRLHFVLPGEKVYLIVNGPGGAATDAGQGQPPPPGGAWYDQVWNSLNGTPGPQP